MINKRHLFLSWTLLTAPVYQALSLDIVDASNFFTSVVGSLKDSMPLTGERGFLNSAANSVASTSVSGFLQPMIKKHFFDPKLYLARGTGKFYHAKPKGVFYNEALQAEIDRHIDILKSLSPEDPKPHFVFRGPPGTGKTLLAKLIAQQAGFSYEFISGAAINQFPETEAIREITELFERIDKKPKKRSDVTVVIFDEAQDFLMENFRQQRYLMANVNNVMFTHTSEPSANYFFIFTYNSLYPIDERWIRRIDYHIHFDLPNDDTRIKLWNHYLKKYMKGVIKKRGSQDELEFFIDNLDSVSATLAAVSDGFTGSNISQVSKALARRLKTQKHWSTFDLEDALTEVARTRKKYDPAGIDFGITTQAIRGSNSEEGIPSDD